VNLVVSLLAKMEFAVRRVVGQGQRPQNEWLFNETGWTWRVHPDPGRGG